MVTLLVMGLERWLGFVLVVAMAPQLAKLGWVLVAPWEMETGVV